MTLPRSVKLQWQQEIIELWLNTPGIPGDSRTGLLDMLSVVKEEMENLRFHAMETGQVECSKPHSEISLSIQGCT
jgi:hypothetical protein